MGGRGSPIPSPGRTVILNLGARLSLQVTSSVLEGAHDFCAMGEYTQEVNSSAAYLMAFRSADEPTMSIASRFGLSVQAPN